MEIKSIEMPFWADDIDEAVRQVETVTAQAACFVQKINASETCGVSYYQIKWFYDNVRSVLDFWTGKTHVGIKKSKTLESKYNDFFLALLSLLLLCNEKKIGLPFVEVERSLYRGPLYRYLGHGDPDDNTDTIVEPEYNNIFVSWSKRPRNQYIEGKLYGRMTLLSCVVSKPYYGIDLCAFDVSRGEENEVVFPTIKETITSIDYMDHE